jgi:hypothetical protein
VFVEELDFVRFNSLDVAVGGDKSSRLATSLGCTAAHRTCAAACAASSACAVDVDAAPPPLASQANEFVSALEAALTSASAPAAASIACAQLSAVEEAGARSSASTAVTTCCAAASVRETVDIVTGSESIESRARAAEVAADASLAASAAELAACTTRVAASSSLIGRVAGARPPPA